MRGNGMWRHLGIGIAAALATTVCVLAEGSPAEPAPRSSAWHHLFESSRGLGQVAEFWCEDGDEQRSVFLVETPAHGRAIVEDVANAPKDRFTTRLTDHETGWWAESTWNTGLNDLKANDWGEVATRRTQDENPIGRVSFRTSDGYSAQASGRAAEDGDLGAEVVAELVGQEGFLASVPRALWEEVGFLATLDGKGRTTLGGVGHLLFELLEKIRTASQREAAPSKHYSFEDWEKKTRSFYPKRRDEPARASFREMLTKFRPLPPCAKSWGE